MSPPPAAGARRREILAWLPVAAVAAGAVMLIVADLADTFAYSAGGSVVETATGGDRHGYAFALIGAFAIAALLLATLRRSRPAPVAIAVAGALGLALFCAIDLPDAGASGTLESLALATAQPRAGFWLELVGSLALLGGGIALSRLRLPLDPATMRGRA